jgi:hypothetical protein
MALKSAMMPVPRRLSASCGVCVELFLLSKDFFHDAGVFDDLEGVYLAKDGDYVRLSAKEPLE